MLMSVILLTALLLGRWWSFENRGGILVLIYGLYITWLLSDTAKIREDEQQVVDNIKRADFTWTGTAYTVMVVVGLTLGCLFCKSTRQICLRDCISTQCSTRYCRFYNVRIGYITS